MQVGNININIIIILSTNYCYALRLNCHIVINTTADTVEHLCKLIRATMCAYYVP